MKQLSSITDDESETITFGAYIKQTISAHL